MKIDIPEATVSAKHGFIRIGFDDNCSLGECLGEAIGEIQGVQFFSKLEENTPSERSLELKLKRIREISAACVGSCDSADALLLALSLIERVAENEDALGELADTVEQIKKVLTA